MIDRKAFWMRAACSTAAVAVGALFVATTALAEERPVVVTAPADVVTRHVSYADLNLASAPGERTLNRRVGGAVNDVCVEATGGIKSTIVNYPMSRCSQEAWAGARPQIALAVQRARDIAATGTSSLAAVAITITIPE